jgi:hypothetical protein
MFETNGTDVPPPCPGQLDRVRYPKCSVISSFSAVSITVLVSYLGSRPTWSGTAPAPEPAAPPPSWPQPQRSARPSRGHVVPCRGHQGTYPAGVSTPVPPGSGRNTVCIHGAHSREPGPLPAIRSTALRLSGGYDSSMHRTARSPGRPGPQEVGTAWRAEGIEAKDNGRVPAELIVGPQTAP